MMLAVGFVHPLFLLGLSLLAIPIIIHFLFRIRYKRVRFAPFSFLLDSQRKQRRRLLIEQLLLLLLRCLAIGLFVLLFARPISETSLNQLSGGEEKVRHDLLIDDSFSMGELLAVGTPADRAIASAKALADRLSVETSSGTIRVFRSSQPREPTLSVALDSKTSQKLSDLFAGARESFFSRPLSDALKELAKDPVNVPSSKRHLHLFTDFREKDWTNAEVRSALLALRDAGWVIDLVDCGDSNQRTGNRGIVDFASIRSLSSVQIDSPVLLQTESYRSESPSCVAEIFVDGGPAPSFTLDALPIGRTAEKPTDLRFESAGTHGVAVRIASDAIRADNFAYSVMDVRERIPILIIDDSPSRSESMFLALALAPGAAARTGLVPTIRGPEALASLSPADFPVTLIASLSNPDAVQTRGLLNYQSAGGTIACFVSESTRMDVWNANLLGPGKLFDLQWSAFRDLAEDPTTGSTDLRFESHPIFRVFEGERNPFLETVRFDRVVALQNLPAENSSTTVIAKHRLGVPLVLEHREPGRHGYLFLTSAKPMGNNWARNPSYVVAMLELVHDLLRPTKPTTKHLIGETLSLDLEPEGFAPTANLSHQRLTESGFIAGNKQIVSLREHAETAGSSAKTINRITLPTPKEPGLYQLELQRIGGGIETKLLAVNVDPNESNISRIPQDKLAEQLRGIPHLLRSSESATETTSPTLDEPTIPLLALLLVILFAEQWWSRRMSYHQA